MVGVQNYTFRPGPDVIAGQLLPRGFAAVLSGHIHRAQLLVCDLLGQPLAAPVIYPGATSRTSFAEREETKGYCLLDFAGAPPRGGELITHHFVALPSRPMIRLELDIAGLSRVEMVKLLRSELASLDPESIVSLQPSGKPEDAEALSVLSAPSLRSLAPTTMNIDLARNAAARRK